MLRKLIWIWKREKYNNLLEDHQIDTQNITAYLCVQGNYNWKKTTTLCSAVFRCFVVMIYNYDIMIAGYDIIMVTFFSLCSKGDILC